MEKRTAITIVCLMIGVAIFANLSDILYWWRTHHPGSVDSTTSQSADSKSNSSDTTDTSPNKRESLGGWQKFKFGMSREQLLGVGGSESHANEDNTEIAYPIQIDGTDYSATALLPHGYVEGILLDDRTAAMAATKEDCFRLADKKAAVIDGEFGKYDDKKSQTLAGIDILTFNYKFEDGNSIVVSSMFSGNCRSAVAYNGPKKEDQGHL